MAGKRYSFELTPKALRIEELRKRHKGMSFDEAFVIADHEYTSDGLSPKPGQQILPIDGVVQSAAGVTVVKHGQEARAI